MSQREILRIIPSQPTSDGDGVKIRRIAAHGNMGLLDPFLLLDEIASDESADYIGGFPPHPHRGFETVTYMLEGLIRHTDHMGNVGLLKSGGIQWMTAGKGVIHSEMPEQTEGRLHGFQLWVNLPAKDKMQPARYQEFDADIIPVLTLENGTRIKTITGKFSSAEGTNIEGPVKNIATNATYFDIHLPAQQSITLPVVNSHNVLIYNYIGEISIGNQTVKQGQMAQLTAGEKVTIVAQKNSQMLFLTGEPIKEPIANYGPFVMNTSAEIEQAIQDYRNGILTD
jgi:redox-sensitive bicupin YhaK (pirin superfamily)